MTRTKMRLEMSWRSEPGTQTDDNRDFCSVGMRPDSTLCIVLDGSTEGQGSGVFAASIARSLIDWFITVDQVTDYAILEQLRQIHAAQTVKFRQASASFVIAWIDGSGHVQFFHAGDCLIGSMRGEAWIEWEMRPHTLANVFQNLSIEEIAASPVRNRVTRSLRAKSYMMPDEGALTLRADMTLVLATDGFWADLQPANQVGFLSGAEQSKQKVQDDRSALSIRFSKVQTSCTDESSAGNCYLRDAQTFS